MIAYDHGSIFARDGKMNSSNKWPEAIYGETKLYKNVQYTFENYKYKSKK